MVSAQPAVRKARRQHGLVFRVLGLSFSLSGRPLWLGLLLAGRLLDRLAYWGESDSATGYCVDGARRQDAFGTAAQHVGIGLSGYEESSPGSRVGSWRASNAFDYGPLSDSSIFF